MRRAILCALLIACLPAATASASVLVDPHEIETGPDDSVWVTDGEGIVRVAQNGSMRRVLSLGHDVWNIARGLDGSMWFTDLDAKRLGRIAPGGAAPEYFQLTRGPGPLVAGPDGNMWFTEQDALHQPRGRIGRITPSGEITEFDSGLPDESRPYDITTGPDGNLWFTDIDRIGRITPQGAITEFESVGDDVSGIVAGPDAALWFGLYQGVGRITTAGRIQVYDSPVEFPNQLARGPDGAVWFTGYEGSAVLARIEPDRHVSMFHRGLSAEEGYDLTLGPNGRDLWVLESGRTGDHVARFTPGSGATEFPPPPPCRVPSMMLRQPLNQALRLASAALCSIDKASRHAGRKHGTVVLSVSPRPGTVHPYDTPLHVKFGPPPPVPKRCALPFGAEKLASSSRMLVYEYTDYDASDYLYSQTTYGACLRPRGDHVRLQVDANGTAGGGFAAGFEIAGRFVAYRSEEDNHYGQSDLSLNVVDVKRARHTYSTEVERHLGDFGPDPGDNPTLGEYAPSRHGAVAWFRVVAGAERLYVHLPGEDRRRTVDRGQLTHLRFDGDTLRWKHAGRARHCDTRDGTLTHCPA
jgi:streptogramin lyase